MIIITLLDVVQLVNRLIMLKRITQQVWKSTKSQKYKRRNAVCMLIEFIGNFVSYYLLSLILITLIANSGLGTFSGLFSQNPLSTKLECLL